MSELSPAAKALVDAARGGDEPTAEDRARAWTALSAAAGAVAATTAAATVSASSPPVAPPVPPPVAAPSAVKGATAVGKAAGVVAKAVSLGVKVKAALAVGAVVAVGAAVTVHEVRAPRESSAPAAHGAPPPRSPAPAAGERVQAPVAAAEVAREGAPEPAPIAVPSSPADRVAHDVPDRRAPRVATPSAPPPSHQDARPLPNAPAAVARPQSLADEAAILRDAQARLARGDRHGARARLDEHGARFPDGHLREEREATRALLACGPDAGDEGRRAAEAFLERFPTSLHASRVRAACHVAPGVAR